MTVRVIALVEGPTEEQFVRKLLNPAFWALGVSIVATTCGRPRLQGGVPAWNKAERELLRLLKQDLGQHVTTMFDYYGLPGDWPGRQAAPALPYAGRANAVEQAIRDRIAAASGDDPRIRFIPYVQMHEFEALLFSDPEILANVISREPRSRHMEGDLKRIADAFGTPEEINDGLMTAPSKRILALAPDYQKITDGNIAVARIGIQKMRESCPHFGGWVSRLEALSQPQ